jgi:hypothetical protein
MRRIALGALTALLALPAAASAGPPITKGPAEGYHSPANHVACVLLLRYNRDGNAVRCGRRGSGTGVLLTWRGAARKVKWRWPTRLPEFYKAPVGRTLYLIGGTAKIQGDRTMLRCTFTGRDHVRCLNRDGGGLDVTRTAARTL